MSLIFREPPPPPALGGRVGRARWRGRAALAALGLGLPLCVLLAVGVAWSRRPASPGVTRYGLNQPARVKEWDLVVAAIERPGTALQWTASGDTQGAVGTWFVVVLAMTNTDTHTRDVTTQDFELRDEQGHVYTVAPETGIFVYSVFKGGQRLGGQVLPGMAVRYYIPFDIDPTATDLTFVFKRDTRPQFSVGSAQT